MKLEDKKLPRKNYSTPRLLIYGNISELTQNVTDQGVVMDNPQMKT